MELHQLQLQNYGLQTEKCRLREITSQTFGPRRVFELSVPFLTKSQREAYWAAVSRCGGEAKLSQQAELKTPGRGEFRQKSQFPVTSQGKTLSGDEFLSIIGDAETIRETLRLIFSER